MWGLVTSFCVVLFYLFRLSGAIIRFGDKYRFCSSGVFSRNLALYANFLLVGLCFVLDGDYDLCLFLFPIDMIRFGEKSDFLIFGTEEK